MTAYNTRIPAIISRTSQFSHRDSPCVYVLLFVLIVVIPELSTEEAAVPRTSMINISAKAKKKKRKSKKAIVASLLRH